ncbi:uncharacterized protein LOC121740907 [Salvia splendens]|uniref:uncharacterized protein LOC121740907 n=1 Tax=Salvia splendens TaxID=180675 RepID=UPI001C2738BC|nr:uncharacterized protein LOC121740907 [Salvia splendens]
MLESESESKKPRERDKRQECEVQKSRESGWGERKEKYQMREKPQAQVSKGCLLDSKANLGWAPSEPLPLALGEENKFLPTNTTCMSSCVDDFVVSKVEDMEVKYQVAHSLETMSPEKDQEERGQVDKLLAQGSSALSLSTCDDSLSVITLEKSLCVDRFVNDDLCKKWAHELESLDVKSIFASHVDSFGLNTSIDRHDYSLVKSTLDVGVTSFRAKMPKLSFVGNFELHEYVDENSRTKGSDMGSDFRTRCWLCFQCKVVKPFNGIGVFYGRFVKDFSTHMSLVDCVVFNGVRIHFFYSWGLKLLEQLCRAYFDKFHMHGVVSCLHVVHSGLWTRYSLIFDNLLKLLGQWNEIHFDELGLLVDTLFCKLDVSCDEPTLYVGQEFVNLWKSIPYLSKNDVLMIIDGLPLYDLEVRDFVLRLFLVIFNYAQYEDHFLCPFSPNGNAKSFVKIFKNLGIDSVGMIEPNRNKVLGACVFWHVSCFYCMSIKPFNVIGMFYGSFIKDFVSNGLVWDSIVKECIGLCAPTSSADILKLFEYWHEGYLDELDVFCYGDRYLKCSNILGHMLAIENVYLHENLHLSIGKRNRCFVFLNEIGSFDHIDMHVRIIHDKGLENVMNWLMLGFYYASINPINGVVRAGGI